MCVCVREREREREGEFERPQPPSYWSPTTVKPSKPLREHDVFKSAIRLMHIHLPTPCLNVILSISGK